MSKNHLSLSLGHGLWEDILRQALPVKIIDGEFQALGAVRGVARRLELRQRVAGLLEDRGPTKPLRRIGRRVRGAWQDRKDVVYARVDELIAVEGTWRFELDDAGTDLRFGRQQVQTEAFLKGTASGTIRLLRSNVEVPFTVSRRIGASVVLGDIAFSREHDAVVGTLSDLVLHVGDARLFQLATRIAERVIAPQLATVNPLPILKREQLEGLVGPLGGPLRMNMGVEDLAIDVTEDAITLHVRFGFTQKQLEDG